MIVTALLAAALACLAWRGTADVQGAVLVSIVAVVGLWVCLTVRRSSPTKNGAAKRAFRCRSLSDISFSLGEPEAPFLRVPDQQMPWFEAEIGLIYRVFDAQNGSACNVREPLNRLRKLVRPIENEHWELREPLDDIMLCRLLIAKDFNVEMAFALAKKYLDYRLEVDGGVRPPAALIASGMVIIPFEDRYGRPVVVVRAKYIDNQMSQEFMQSGYRAIVDCVIAHLLHKRCSQVNGANPLEQYVLVWESEGAGWSNFTTQIAKTMVKESNSHYPERLAQILILNCTHFVRLCFQMVSPMLHPRTVKKTKLITSDKVAGVMQSLVEPEKLPIEYGGSAPSWSSPIAARNMTERMGAVVAATHRRLGLMTAGEEAEEEPHERIIDDIPRSSSEGGFGGCCCVGWRQ